MSDEFEVEPAYSPFWPMAILVAGLLIWSGYQAYQGFSEKSNLTTELDSAGPTIKAAENVQTRLYAVAQDLIQTSAKDANAAQIVKEANIQVKPGATNAAALTAPDSSK
jgi:hypothetical protein